MKKPVAAVNCGVQSPWIGWVLRLVEWFQSDRDCIGSFASLPGDERKVCRVSFPVLHRHRGEVWTLAAELLPGGTGAVYPHPVLAAPFVCGKESSEAMHIVMELINKRTDGGEHFESGYDITWHLRGAHDGRQRRSITGTSIGAAFLMAVSSLIDAREVDHTICATGAVSADGRILQVHGMSAKLRAVCNAAVNTSDSSQFIIPSSNYRDIRDAWEPQFSSLVELHPVSTVDEVLILRRAV